MPASLILYMLTLVVNEYVLSIWHTHLPIEAHRNLLHMPAIANMPAHVLVPTG
jgi:hypothetical protein